MVNIYLLEESEAAIRGLETSQNLQENTCARVSFLTKLQAFHDMWISCVKGKT